MKAMKVPAVCPLGEVPRNSQSAATSEGLIPGSKITPRTPWALSIPSSPCGSPPVTGKARPLNIQASLVKETESSPPPLASSTSASEA